MKKAISIILIMLCFASNTIVDTSAIIEDTCSEIIYLEGGYYIIYTIEESFFARTTNTKSGTKTIKIYDNNDVKCADATITGTFTYTGSSSTCTNASINYNIYVDNWKMKEATASKTDNKAIGNIIAKRYLLGIPVQTVDETITLTCSANGTLS